MNVVFKKMKIEVQTSLAVCIAMHQLKTEPSCESVDEEDIAITNL